MPLARYSAALADALHTEGINLALTQAEGVVLMGARSLSRNGAYRALAARRVVHWLLRWLQREAPWLVFEPLNPGLVEDVRLWVQNLLRRLWRGGALRGNSEAEAFFVRVAAEPRRQGELRVDIGLALAEPLEFIVVRLSLADDGLQLAPAAFAAAEV
jgi:phage tail sheath protein FI